MNRRSDGRLTLSVTTNRNYVEAQTLYMTEKESGYYEGDGEYAIVEDRGNGTYLLQVFVF